MDLVDSNLKAMNVISVFGLYAKFLVEEIGRECMSMAGEHYAEIYLWVYECSAHMNVIVPLQALPMLKTSYWEIIGFYLILFSLQRLLSLGMTNRKYEMTSLYSFLTRIWGGVQMN